MLWIAWALLGAASPSASTVLGADSPGISTVLGADSPSEASHEDGAHAFVQLVVNTVVKESILVTLQANDVIVQRKDLFAAGIDLAQAGPSQEANVSLSRLAPAVTFRFDINDLRLSLTVAPSLLTHQVIDLRPGKPIDLTYRKDTSAYFNYDVRLSDFIDLTTAVELGVSVGGAFLYSSAQLNSQTWVPVRGLSNVTFNNPDKMERWILGDTFASTGNLGGGVFLGGVTFARSFELDPYFVPRPLPGYTGAVATPSTMDVYVNDMLVRREAVAPGTFSVQNLPATVGGGVYRYVLHDAFGNISEVQSPYYLARQTLPRGVTDFNLSLGIERYNLGTSSFDYATLAGLASFRRGLTNWLTAGARVEGSLQMFSGGTGWAARIPIGEVSLDGAGSFDSGQPGAAGALAYSYLSRLFSTSLYVRGMSDFYATLSQPAGADRPLLDAGLTVAVPITPLRVSMTATYADQIMRDQGSRQIVSGSLYIRFDKRVWLQALAQLDIPRVGPRDYSIYTGLSVQLDSRTTATASWTQTPSGGQALATVNHSALLGTGVGYNAYAGYAPQDRQATFGVYGQYQSPYGIHSASFDYINGQSHPAFETRGGIAMVGTHGVFASRPIQTGFASVSVSGLKGVRVYLNNQEIGRTDNAGQVLVPVMLPYYGNRVSIADADVPLDYRLDNTAQTVAGPQGGGVAVAFSATRIHYYRGVFEVESPHGWVGAKDGEVRLVGRSGGSITAPLGRDGRFELDSPAPGTYAATIDWQGGLCTMPFVVPASGETIVDLGVMRCRRMR